MFYQWCSFNQFARKCVESATLCVANRSAPALQALRTGEDRNTAIFHVAQTNVLHPVRAGETLRQGKYIRAPVKDGLPPNSVWGLKS